MKIALGTTSKYKIAFIKKACQELDFKCEIVPTEVPSGIADQPLTSDETRLGSINRARAALERINRADAGLGIEVGYEKIDNSYNILCWATIFHNNNLVSCCSKPFPLPKFHDDIIKKGLYLGDHVRSFAALSNDLGHLKLANDIIYREPYIIDAVKQLIKRLI